MKGHRLYSKQNNSILMHEGRTQDKRILSPLQTKLLFIDEQGENSR